MAAVPIFLATINLYPDLTSFCDWFLMIFNSQSSVGSGYYNETCLYLHGPPISPPSYSDEAAAKGMFEMAVAFLNFSACDSFVVLGV